MEKFEIFARNFFINVNVAKLKLKKYNIISTYEKIIFSFLSMKYLIVTPKYDLFQINV